MMNVKTRPFEYPADLAVVWRLMTECYAPCCENGMAAPFFEYAVSSAWFDAQYLHLNRLWMEGERAVGFVFYESPATSLFFHLLPGYEALAQEMIDYADRCMPDGEGREFVLFPGQKALMEAALTRGYHLAWSNDEWVIDFDKAQLQRALPEGFHFVEASQADMVKLARCTWKGFDHEEKGPFENWDGPDTNAPWTPQKAYRDLVHFAENPPPHATFEHHVIIADETGEYACFSGMWWTPENQLAYMEPLCTVPEHRGKGLAAAALARHYQRMKALGAKHMTGGESDFYRRLGYTDKIRRLHWKKTS